MNNNYSKEDIKPMYFKMPKDMWIFLKKRSIEKEMPISQLLIEVIKQFKNKVEKKLD